MKPVYTFSDDEKNKIFNILNKIDVNPYREYNKFFSTIDYLINNNLLPSLLEDVFLHIKFEREVNNFHIHVLSNCPIDIDIPMLNLDDPVLDKYMKKNKYVSEAFLLIASKFLKTPLLSYGERNNGDFFTDVIAINRFKDKVTGFAEGNLVYHNDRTSHPVRADYISLLGLRCPNEDLVYTCYIDCNDIIKSLSKKDIDNLRRPYFYTEIDDFSKNIDGRRLNSSLHAILSNNQSIRYLDTLTKVSEDSPIEAKDSLIALKDAITKSKKYRHRIVNGDFLTFSNQGGLHNREHIEVNNQEKTRNRWLMKTYAFRNSETADSYENYWINNLYGCVKN